MERSTRFTILLHLPDGHDAKHVQQAVIRKMQYLPKLLRNSLTWDQGSELALHKRISTTLDMQVYFRDPQNTRLQETIRENTRTHQHSMIRSHQSKTAIKSGKTHRCCNHH